MTEKHKVEGKYLGKLLMEGPLHARPHKAMLHRMIQSIDRNAPVKKKQRIKFDTRVMRPMVPNSRASSCRQTREVLVGEDGDSRQEVFCIPMQNIVSVGAWKRCFCFITSDNPYNDTSTCKTRRSGQEAVPVTRFNVHAFRSRSFSESHASARTLIGHIEQSRIKDVQFLQQVRKQATRVSRAWLEVDPSEVPNVMQAQGRHDIMSPLPSEIPASVQTVSDRPQVCSPLSSDTVDGMSEEMRELQEALNCHSLSPRSASYRASLPSAPCRSHLRPPYHRAKALQKQFGDAINSVTSVTENTPFYSGLLSVQGQSTLTEEGERIVMNSKDDIPESGYNSEASSTQGSNVSLLSEEPMTALRTVKVIDGMICAVAHV